MFPQLNATFESIPNAQHVLRFLSVLILFFLNPSSTYSQHTVSSPLRIVAGASFDRNVAPASIETFGKGTIACGTFRQGGENAWSGSLGVRLPGALFGMTFSPYLEYRDLSSEFTLTPPNDVHIANLSHELELVSRERVYSGNVAALYLGATLDVLEWQGVSFGISPAVGIPVRKSYSEEERILSNNVYYIDNSSGTPVETPVLNVRGGEVNTNPVFFDVGFGVSTSYRLKNGLILQPSLRGTLPVVGIGKDAAHTWSVYKMSAGLSFGFDLGEEVIEDPQPVHPQPVEPEPQKPAVVEAPVSIPPELEPAKPSSILMATITAVGMNDDGSRVEEPTLTVEKLQVTEAIPTLNYVFFGATESALDTRYVKFTSGNSVPQFDERKLFAASAETVHHQILNIIGSRMYQDKSATIMLVGTRSTSDETASDLGKQRAESIAGYLADQWQIDRSRIKIQSRQLPENASDDQTPHGQEENRRVEIIPNKPSIVAPVWANRIERVATPPRILFEPKIVSDTDVVSATIFIRQNDNVLQTFDALSDGGVGDHLWKLSESSMPGGQDSIIYDLVVRDVLGNEVKTSGSIKLKQIRREVSGYRTDSLAADRKVEKYSLILFDYSSSSLAKHQADTIINYVARSVRNGSRLTITGHTDKTGNDAFNEQLAGQRAKRAAELLEKRLSALRKAKPEMQVASHGSRDILFDNTKPEGRFLSRTVRVTVEEVLH